MVVPGRIFQLGLPAPGKLEAPIRIDHIHCSTLFDYELATGCITNHSMDSYIAALSAALATV